MNLFELALRFIAGGTLVAAVSLLAKTRHLLLAGLFLLFPMVTLVGLYFAGSGLDPAGIRKITLFSMAGLPATLAFLAAFYMVVGRVGVVSSLLLSTLVWCVCAALIGAIVRAVV
jgi:membrane protein GlpM